MANKTHNPEAELWKKSYEDMCKSASVLMTAMAEIRDNPCTHENNRCVVIATHAISNANAALRPNEKAHRPERAGGDFEMQTRTESARSGSVQRPGSAYGTTIT